MPDIRKADPADLHSVTALALRLWPGHDFDTLAGEFDQLLREEEAAIFLAWVNSEAVGFAQCQLRHDYVEGTESSPVGYLEGIYVADPLRRRGIARSLLQACEGWAKKNGCREFASDCELTNTDSLRFHLGLGFAEAGRIICFTKRLEE